MSSFYVENFGCRATQADGAAIERELLHQGFSRAPRIEDAEVVVLNTCTVTQAADRDARAAIRRLHRHHPETKIMVTGCYAQRAPEELAALPGVTWVLGNSHKHEVSRVVAENLQFSKENFVPLHALGVADRPQTDPALLWIGDIFAHTELLSAPVFEATDKLLRTRPNLKVQDGCNNRCSFCIIPYTRGKSRSLPTEQVIGEIDQLVAAGYRELVITGINLGRWGRDFASPGRFEDLLRAILDKTVVEKLRISSVEPMDWSNELIELVATSPRVAKHAHLPLQSGSDKILRAMHRRYRPWHYAERIRKIRDAMPSAAIGADVMVGFPGETDDLFEESRSFIAGLPFTYLHVFTFSPRPGTPAAAMPQQVPLSVARERNRILRQLSAAKNRTFRESFLGHTLTAITLGASDDEFTDALSDNFLKMRIRGTHKPNQWVTPRAEEISADGLIGSC